MSIIILREKCHMDRREFLKHCAVGMTINTASLPLLKTVRADDMTVKQDIDPAELAARVYEHFIPGKLTCGESILMAGCEALGIQSELISDIALGLGGGVGLQGNVCGVLTGSALVLSLAIAQKEKEYPKKKMATFQAVGRVYNAFKERIGDTQCRTLCGLDLTTPEGRKKLEGGIKKQVCTRFVKVGAELLAEELQRL